MKEKDKHQITIEDILKSHKQGLTISEIMKKLNLARHTVLARLNMLEGQNKVNLRKINMAKLYYWKDEEEKLENENHPKMVNLKESHLKINNNIKIKKFPIVNIKQIKEEINEELRTGKLKKEEAQVKEQRKPIIKVIENYKDKTKKTPANFIKTGIEGLDELFEDGIPKGSSVLIAGGAGSGKTIFCLQTLAYHAKQSKKCLYMSFEESEERLMEHMEGFGWNPKELIKKGNLMIKRFNPFDITRSVDALLMKAKGELLIDVEPVILPKNFKPDFIVVDSLTAIASAFVGKEDSYRIYVEQLFRFLEGLETTSFLIAETKQIPEIFSTSGVEEFLADGVIVFYNIKHGDVRESAIEVLKMRGEKHQKKIVAMQISPDNGIVVYPEQEVFGGIEEK
ncbi:MAG: ATPase domain-containing protein [Candidatus Nanoarchaeia archaeon]